MTPAAWLYLALGVLVCLVAWRKRLDPDVGGYPSTFRDPVRRSRPARDKVQHFLGSAALAFVAGLLMALAAAGAITLALGVGWELQQRFPYDRRRPGYGDWRDVVADAGGVLGGCTLAWIVRAVTGWSP